MPGSQVQGDRAVPRGTPQHTLSYFLPHLHCPSSLALSCAHPRVSCQALPFPFHPAPATHTQGASLPV